MRGNQISRIATGHKLKIRIRTKWIYTEYGPEFARPWRARARIQCGGCLRIHRKVRRQTGRLINSKKSPAIVGARERVFRGFSKTGAWLRQRFWCAERRDSEFNCRDNRDVWRRVNLSRVARQPRSWRQASSTSAGGGRSTTTSTVRRSMPTHHVQQGGGLTTIIGERKKLLGAMAKAGSTNLSRP